jgi:predicted Zn-dependent peptidase
LLILFISAVSAIAQRPRQEKLLNGLKVLMWNEPKTDKVSLKVRIHSGSAFDPQQKEGLMRLLADNIFPNEGAKEFFSEELDGSLEVVSNYDYIQINAVGRSERLLDILQTLANAVTNTPIDKETTVRLRTALLGRVRELEKDPAYQADQAAVKRLFGTFPYGRPQMGSSESVQKIEYPDLLDAKQRFLTADNATVTISGAYNSDRAFRAIQRYFGGWLKSDKKIPSTFRQPDEPDSKRPSFGVLTPGSAEVRFAMRGVSRSDKDFPASEVLTRIALARWQALPALAKSTNLLVRNEAHILPGYLMFSATLLQPLGDDAGAKFGTNLIPANISESEFSAMKAVALAWLNSINTQDRWLDVDTFKSLPVENETAAYQDLTLADVQRVADRLAKNPVVAVLYTTPAEPAAAN